ncbi:MAG: sulfatase [Opitutales bacterium]
MPEKPLNILYFVVHDLGKHLGCYNGGLIHSPRLDAFARESFRFHNAFTNAACCSPSRGCAMTGQYSHVNGQIGLAHMGWSLPQSAKTIVDYFNEAGRTTVHCGLNHERHAGENHYQHDFEEHWDDWDAANAVTKALTWLEKRPADADPFYLNIGTHDVHASRFTKEPAAYAPYKPAPEDVFVPPWLHDTPQIRAFLANFQSAIGYLDVQFGRLLDGLDRLALRETTLVVFTTAHGIAVPPRLAKGTCYDRGMEIALLARMPGPSAPGSDVHHLIQNIDFTPTFLELTGAPVPDSINGRSFAPLLQGQPYQPHEYIFVERNCHGEHNPEGPGFRDVYDPVRSVRTSDFHLIRHCHPELKDRPLRRHEAPPPPDANERTWPTSGVPRAETELYYIAQDPLELFDVVNQPEYAPVRDRLSTLIDTWMRDTDDLALSSTAPTPPEKPGWGPWENL